MLVGSVIIIKTLIFISVVGVILPLEPDIKKGEKDTYTNKQYSLANHQVWDLAFQWMRASCWFYGTQGSSHREDQRAVLGFNT